MSVAYYSSYTIIRYFKWWWKYFQFKPRTLQRPLFPFRVRKYSWNSQKIQACSPSQDGPRKKQGKDVWRGGVAQKCMGLSDYCQGWGEWRSFATVVYAAISLICNSWFTCKNGMWAASTDFWVSWAELGSPHSFNGHWGSLQNKKVRWPSSALHADWVLPCLLFRR